MADPVDNQDANNGSGASESQPQNDEDTGKPRAVALPVGQKTQHERDGAQSSPHRDGKKSKFDIVARVLEIIIGAAVGGALIGVGYLQYTVYSGQLIIMQADHRPWAAVAGNLAAQSDLIYNNGVGSFGIQILIKNFSKTPAFAVYTIANTYISFNAKDIEPALKVLCEKAKQGDPITNTEGGVI